MEKTRGITGAYVVDEEWDKAYVVIGEEWMGYGKR